MRSLRLATLLLAACGGEPSSVAPADAGAAADALVWPNAESRAISDVWISRHHDEIQRMEPRVLALNFVNGRTNADMEALFARIFDGLAEGSRYHGYAGPAPAFLRYRIGVAVDLTDHPPPPGWTLPNSTKYPRKPPGAPGAWSFDYGALFGEAYTAYFGVADPDDPSRNLSLCEMLDRGIVHEVWIYGAAAEGDVDAAEVLEHKQRYDASGAPSAGQFDRCAGNGCFDDADVPPCGRSVRIGWVNHERGPGCMLHSLGHGFEATAALGATPGGIIPALRETFLHFGNFDLDRRFGVGFRSFYDVCGARPDCLTFAGQNAVTWMRDDGESGMLDPFDQGCGNVHFPPNAAAHYDYFSVRAVLSTCEGYGLGGGRGGADLAAPYTAARIAAYEARFPDCGGGWQVYWRQSFPGLGNPARDARGAPIPSWWPYLFY